MFETAFYIFEEKVAIFLPLYHCSVYSYGLRAEAYPRKTLFFSASKPKPNPMKDIVAPQSRFARVWPVYRASRS